jgi:hypothetical protein
MVAMALGMALLMTASQSPARWVGTIVADVSGTQPGAQHTTRTIIQVTFIEEHVGAQTRLRSVGSRYQMKADISGLGSCRGSADVRLTEAVGRSAIDASGEYRLVLERGFFGWACGTNVRATGARDVVIGMRPDPESRRVERNRMAGRYVVHQETSDSTYEFTVEWEITRL